MLSINSNPDVSLLLMCRPVATFGNMEQETDDDLVLDNNFGKLIADLKAILGTSKGLSSEEVNIDQVKKIMEDYESDEAEWGRFALSDALKGYTRNGVVNINGNANLLVLVWSPGKGSAIHDHANAHCCMKILKGQLSELLYDVPDHECQMEPKKVTTLHRNQVGYILDKIGLHRISNASNDEFSVSLHLYTPPYASLYGCSMYETNTAKKHHVNMSKYYSWQGTLLSANSASTC